MSYTMKKQTQFLTLALNLCSLFLLLLLASSCSKKKDPVPVVITPPVSTTTPPAVTKSSAKDVLTFAFSALSPAVAGKVDATAKTISATVASGIDLTKLVPALTISDKATVSPASGVAQDFSKEVLYTVTAEDASTAVYKVNVTKQSVVASTTTDFIYLGQQLSKTLLKAFDATTGKEVWSFIPNTASNTSQNSNPYVSDGIVYIAGSDKNIYALDTRTGAKIWEYATDIYRTNPVSANGVLYCAGSDGKFYALDAKNGTKKWSIDLGTSSFPPTSPVVVNNIVYTSSIATGTSGVVYALDAATGQTKWKQASNVTGKDVCVVNGLVFVVNGDSGITALDANTGTVKWKIGDSANSPAENLQTTMNDILYTVTYSTGSVIALDAKTGTRKWISKYDPKGNTSQGSPIGADGIIYTVSGDGICYALDAVTGTIKWSVAEFAFQNEDPIVANNLVYSSKGAIDAKTGASKLKFSSALGGRGGLALWINGKAYHSSRSGDVQ